MLLKVVSLIMAVPSSSGVSSTTLRPDIFFHAWMAKRSEIAGFGGGSGWVPSGLASSWEYRAAQSRQARPEEAQEPSWGTAKGGGHFDHAAPHAADQVLACIESKVAQAAAS